MLYSFLALAVMTAIWLDRSKTSRMWRATAAATILLSMLPNLSGPFWTTPLTVPQFFSGGSYRKYVVPGENVLVLPSVTSAMPTCGNFAPTVFPARWRLCWHLSAPGEARSWPIFYAFQQAQLGRGCPNHALQLEELPQRTHRVYSDYRGRPTDAVRDHAGADPPLGRHRKPGRPHRRPRPGAERLKIRARRLHPFSHARGEGWDESSRTSCCGQSPRPSP